MRSLVDDTLSNDSSIDSSTIDNTTYEYEASPTDQYNYSHTFLAVGILLLQSGAILSLQAMFAELWNDQIISWCIALALPLLTLLVIQTGAKQYIAYFTITCTAFIETIVNAVQITKHLLHNTELSTAIHHTAALNDYAFAWLISLVLCVVSIMCEIHYFNLKNAD